MTILRPDFSRAFRKLGELFQKPLIRLVLAAFLTAILLFVELMVFRTTLSFDLLIRFLVIPFPYAIAEKVVFFPLLTLIFFCILIRQAQDLPDLLRFSGIATLYQLSTAVLYYFFCYFLTQRLHVAATHAFLFTLLFYGLAGLMFFSCFLAFLDLKALVRTVLPYKGKIGFALLFAFLFFASKPFLQQYWKGLSYSVAWIVSSLLKLTFTGVLFTRDNFGLAIQGFQVNIYKPCSGVEGMTLFLFVYIAYLMVDWHTVSKMRALFVGLLGILAMYLANVIRIYLIMALGFEVFQHMGMAAASTLVLRYFHGNVGWFLYGVVILIYVAWTRSFVMRPLAVKTNSSPGS